MKKVYTLKFIYLFMRKNFMLPVLKYWTNINIPYMSKKFIILFVAIGITHVCVGQQLDRNDAYALYTPGAAMQAQTPPAFAIRTNLLYWGATLMSRTDVVEPNLSVTPNLGIEVGINKHMTVSLIGAWNPFKPSKEPEPAQYTDWYVQHPKMVHWIIEPEFRYWFCERFNGSALGLHTIFTRYNIGGHDVPSLVDKLFNPEVEFKNLFNRNKRYDGFGAGAGISYNYHLILGKHLGMEFTVGAGYVFLKYDKFSCTYCSEADKESPVIRHYVGPTKLGINLIYVIK